MTTLATIDEIKKTIPFLSNKWTKQNDIDDNDTGFIYYCQKLKQVIDLSTTNNCDIDYAIHRWYNFQCSKYVENLFCKYGAIHYQDEKDHDIDILIEDIPFDVKLSVISSKYCGNKNLSNRDNKDKYIKWLQENQSMEGRKHTKNKLYVICKPRNNEEDKLICKSKFEVIEPKIQSFMNYFKTNIDNYKNKELINELIFVET